MSIEKLDNEIDITFFVPCLNEEANVISTIETIIVAAGEVKVSYEILVYDDNSTDDTVRRVECYQEKNLGISIKLVKNRVTMGLGRNYMSGAMNGRGRHYMMVCGDDVIPREFILRLLEKLNTADMIIPNFIEYDNRPLIRKLVSSSYTAIINLLSGYQIKYYNGGGGAFER